MHSVTVQFEVKAEQAEAFLSRVVQQAKDSLELETECHVFDVCHAPENRNQVLLYEVYSDAAAFNTHLETPHFIAFDAEVSGWIITKTVHQWELKEVKRGNAL